MPHMAGMHNIKYTVAHDHFFRPRALTNDPGKLLAGLDLVLYGLCVNIIFYVRHAVDPSSRLSLAERFSGNAPVFLSRHSGN
jgi:hypothetical protein